MPGETRINLFLFIEDLDDLFRWGWTYPLELAYYRMLGWDNPIIFPVGQEELREIDPRISSLFGYEAWLVAMRYEGPLGALREDLRIPRRFGP